MFSDEYLESSKSDSQEKSKEEPKLFDIPKMIATKGAMDADLDHIVRDIEHFITRYNIRKKRVLSMISEKLP